MCYPAVSKQEEQIMKKLDLCKGIVIDGHAPGLSGRFKGIRGSRSYDRSRMYVF